MSFERPDTVFYDSNENQKFRSALVEITRLAYEAAQESDEKESQYENVTGDLLVADIEAEIDGERREYSFYAEKGGASVEIQSIAFTEIEDLTVDAVRLIHDEMLASDVHSEMRSKFSYDFDEVKNAMVEQFMRRSFHVQLDTGEVRVRSDMGYMVDAVEVRGASDEQDPTELDRAREKIFERDDFREFIQAVHTLGLVDDGQIKRFLRQF